MSTPITWDAAAGHVRLPGRILAAAGGLGAVFQLLFWDVLPGLSFPVYVGLVLAAIWWTAHRHGIVPARSSGAVAATAAVLAAAVAVRAEPLTTVVNVLVVAGLLAVLVHAFGSDRWLRYGLRDWLLAALRLSGHGIVGAPGLVRAARHGRAPARGTVRARSCRWCAALRSRSPWWPSSPGCWRPRTWCSPTV